MTIGLAPPPSALPTPAESLHSNAADAAAGTPPFAASRVSPSNQLAQHRQRVRPHHRCSGELLTAAWIASRTGQYSAWPGATTSKWFAPATDTTITLSPARRAFVS